MKFLIWLKNYWYIPVFVLGAILFWAFFRKKGTPITLTVAEINAIQAGAEAKKLEAEIGTVKAKQAVEKKYREEYTKLNEEQKKEANALAKDPQKLARFLVRAGSSR